MEGFCKKYDLEPFIRLNTKVVEAVWHELEGQCEFESVEAYGYIRATLTGLQGRSSSKGTENHSRIDAMS